MVTAMGEKLPTLRVVLAQPRGFCAGVERAIAIVEGALDTYGAPVYVRHEIIHNHHVVEDLRARGVVFVDEVDQLPNGAITVFSAHGVSKKVERDADARQLDVIDATCPFVHKVHQEGRRYGQRGYDVVLIGHAGHAEVEGTRGQIPGRLHVLCSVAEVDGLEVADPARVAYVTQTTLSIFDTRDIIAALKRRFPAIVGPETSDICYASQNRQMAVVELASRVQLVLVIGARNSSNSNRLREIGVGASVPSHLIEQPSMIDPAWLDGVDAVGITAGASAPERLVQETIAHLRSLRPVEVETLAGIEENVQLRLPPRLADAALRRAESQASVQRR
jgi:4-hydroxy-3-methylbut-2-en-1-yl diphosphate reductase